MTTAKTTVAPEKAKAPRKIVTNMPQLVLMEQQPEAVRKEALYFMDSMPGVTFEMALKLAMYNHGRAEHPVYSDESVETLTEQTAPPSA